MAVYFYYGDEDFNIELELNKMKSLLSKDFISMNLLEKDNPEFSELINLLRISPMMFGKMLIIINSEKYFFSQKKFFEDSELVEIENALKKVHESVDIVFVVKILSDEGKKLDSRKKIYKILNNYNSQEFTKFKTYKLAEISNWIKNHAKKYKDITLKNDAIDLLIEQIGNNLRQFDTELDKLKLIAYPQKIITKEMVQQIVISNQDLFNITELILLNKKDKALLEFQKLVDKKHPLEIISAIQTMLKRWIIIKIKTKDASPLEISKLTGLHEFIVKQTQTKLNNINLMELVSLKQNLYDVECKIKSGEILDINSEVEIALIR